MEVLTPIPLILDTFFEELKTRYTTAEFKFDPQMNYISSVSGLRVLRHSLDLTSQNVLPLFVFNRTNLVPMDDFNRRFNPVQKSLVTGTAIEFHMKALQFNVMFKVFHSDVLFTDTFEVMYGVVEGVNTIRSFTVTLPEVGDFDFYVDWGPLDEAEYNKEDNLYLSKSFSCNIKGSFFVFDETADDLNLINTIQARILDFHSKVLSNLTIS